MSTISAGTSNTTSLIYTGDTTGNLMFQTNGTTEAMRITSGQRVGIGSTAPQSPLEVYGLIRTTGFVANPTSGAGMEMAWDGTQGIVQAFSDRTAATTAPVYFTGGQIKFPATQNASSDPNTLDDYEEGTWSPSCSSNAGSITSYTSAGHYTKIGRMVYLSFNINITNAGTGSSGFNVSNLPFAIGYPQTAMGVGRENARTGDSLTIQANSLSYSSTSLLIYTYNNNTAIYTGNNNLCSVVYYV